MEKNFALFKRKGQKIWYFYHYKGNIRISKSTGKKLKWEAKQFAEEFLKQNDTSDISLIEFAEEFFLFDKCKWIDRQHKKGKSFSAPVAKSRRSHLINYIFPKFGNYQITEINPNEIEDWLLNELELANQTKNHILYSLNIILKEAKRDKIIQSNPIDDVDPLAPNFKKRDILTLEELKILFPKSEKDLLKLWKTPKWVALFFVLASTGIRCGEVRALQWKHIAWDLSGLFLELAVKSDGSISLPKANEIRVILLPSRTIDILKWWYSDTVFKNQNDLIFPGQNSKKPLNRRGILRHFKKVINIAKLKIENRNIVVHSFRHTYNTHMRKILPEEILREFTGHRSEKMTDRYDHPILEDRLEKLQSVKKLIERVWE